jgi:GrpB-like predicted nucleotidyltransferase (UPF0157 family)
LTPTSPVTIHEYDVAWPHVFETIRMRIAPALDGMAAAVEHVGSTAVPGLAAKPIIDIDVLLRNAAGLPLAITGLASLGYLHRGDLGVPGREAFRTPPGEFPHHLYVYPPENEQYRRHLVFRDYLRTHPEHANAYASLKRELAAKFRDDREAYNEAKTGFVAEILRRASGPALHPRAVSL